MSSREFARWQAFDREEPIGDRRADLQTALIAYLIAESNRNRKERREPFTVEEFTDALPHFRPPELEDLVDVDEGDLTPEQALLRRIRRRLAGESD